MYRSSSSSRSLDGFTASPPPVKKNTSTAAFDLLPRYTQLTVEDQKKQSKFKAEHSVHFIPLVLILCGLVLWFSGGAPHGDFALAKHHETVMTKIRSSNIGDDLEENKPLSAGGSVDFKQLNNVSMTKERIQNSR
ncbi:hypothetical protein SUGI_0698880 [Cryptomeria japonica]|uniref:uncharacterized protein LOC131056394 n=1 Tax=Cryptomeria japonica TaxID=3369 RepID=UPI0024147277|nr:uncharacterized protein LOC131056394 [Cryptomeria japonica]GLJ34728.1 hypothetical protein SUGI_0698880 [Cryptomeria japonica]